MKFQRSVWILLFCVGIFFGCKHQRASENNSQIRGLDKEIVIAKSREANLKFSILTLKGKADFEDLDKGSKIGFVYRIDIAKDSLILISISKFGIPALNMLLTKDTVFVKMSINQTGMICDYELLKKMVGIDFDLIKLQNFLTGDAGLEEPLNLTSYKGGEIALQGRKSDLDVYWILNTHNYRLEKLRISDRNLAKESVITYSDFEKIEGQSVASNMLLEVTQPQKLRIELHHSGIAFDKEKVNFRFRIPESYNILPCEKPVQPQN